MDLVHPVSTFGMNIICHLVFPQRDSKACQCVQKWKQNKQPAQEQGRVSPSGSQLSPEGTAFHGRNPKGVKSQLGKDDLGKNHPWHMCVKIVVSKLLMSNKSLKRGLGVWSFRFRVRRRGVSAGLQGQDEIYGLVICTSLLPLPLVVVVMMYCVVCCWLGLVESRESLCAEGWTWTAPERVEVCFSSNSGWLSANT